MDTRSIRQRDGYVIHEAGKPPGFALEAASHTTRSRGDTGPKQTLYAQIGIGEYWRSDPTGGARYGSSLAGDILTGGEYQPVGLTTEKDGMVWGYSTALDLCLFAADRCAARRP